MDLDGVSGAGAGYICAGHTKPMAGAVRSAKMVMLIVVVATLQRRRLSFGLGWIVSTMVMKSSRRIMRSNWKPARSSLVHMT